MTTEIGRLSSEHLGEEQIKITPAVPDACGRVWGLAWWRRSLAGGRCVRGNATLQPSATLESINLDADPRLGTGSELAAG